MHDAVPPLSLTPTGDPGSPEAGRYIRTAFSGWLRQLTLLEGSDLHVKPGSPPLVRAGGDLRRLDCELLTSGATAALAELLIPQARRARFELEGAVDFAHSE